MPNTAVLWKLIRGKKSDNDFTKAPVSLSVCVGGKCEIKEDEASLVFQAVNQVLISMFWSSRVVDISYSRLPVSPPRKNKSREEEKKLIWWNDEPVIYYRKIINDFSLFLFGYKYFSKIISFETLNPLDYLHINIQHRFTESVQNGWRVCKSRHTTFRRNTE